MSELIYEDTQELLEGLTSSDTGERRAAALESFNNNINEFQEKIEEIVAINTSNYEAAEQTVSIITVAITYGSAFAFGLLSSK